MEESKLLPYGQFRDKVFVDGKRYFQNPRFKKPNFEIRMREEMDAYQTPVEMVYLLDLNRPDFYPPAYELMIIYENYCRSRDADKVIRLLVEMMEKQYPEEEAPVEENGMEFSVVTMLAEGNEETGNVYIIAEENARYGVEELLCEEDTLAPLAEKEKADLQILPLGDTAVLAVPVHTLEEYEENLEVMTELWQLELERVQELDSQVYDRSRNLLLKDPEEIKELLIKGKVPKKGIFLR